MNNEQLENALRNVGMECFVKYFPAFADVSVPKKDLIDLLMKENCYKETATVSRVANARRIIRAGHAWEVLNRIAGSKVDPEVREEAMKLRDGMSLDKGRYIREDSA